MRLTLLCASTALAAGLLLSACSSGGSSQAIPGGSQSVGAPMGQHAPHIVAVNPGQQTSGCPSSKYLLCIDINKASGGSFGLCISTSGNCSSGLVGEWTWATKVTTLKGKSAKKKIHNSWDPNPGNPSTNSFTEVKKVKPSKNGSVKYVANVNACEVTNPSSCLSGAVGLIPQ
ncbi:MAG: hypothetical protein WA814_10450 [Candidatus Baltobacteraceae bacterium]